MLYDDFSKKVHVIFKPINSSFLSRKNYDGGKFTLTPVNNDEVKKC